MRVLGRSSQRAGGGAARIGRVLLLTSSYPRAPGDASAHFMERYARSLGVPCTVVAPGAPWSPEVAQDGALRVRRFPYFFPRSLQRLAHGAGMPDNVRAAPWTLVQLPMLLGAWIGVALREAPGCDVIDAHWAVPAGLVGACVARLTGLPLRVVLHSGDVHALRWLAGGRALARLLARSSRTTATSQHVAGLFAELSGAATPVVLPMGVDLPDVPTRPQGCRTIAFVGRLVPVKGVGDLIAACRDVPGVTLEIAGDGPERPALEELARRLGVTATFHGMLGPVERDVLLARAGVAAFPSRVLPGGRTESAPVALLEAFAVGVPVVATRVGGVPELVTDGRDGLLVPPDSPDALAAALRRILDDPALAARLGSSARSTAERYSWTTLGPLHLAELRLARDSLHRPLGE